MKNKKLKKKVYKFVYTMSILILCSIAGIKYYESYTVNKALDAQIVKLKEKIYEEKEKHIEYLKDKEYYKTDLYIEKMAREKFGLVKKDEKIFVIEEQ